MQELFTQDPVFIAMLAALAVVSFFSLRYMLRFGQQVKQNRQAGIYDDPEFKRRIQRLNIQRYGLAIVEVLFIVPVGWLSATDADPRNWIPIMLILFLPIAIWLGVVDHRWRKLMTKGIEQAPKAES